MPATADPMFVFYRIRIEVQRLMYLDKMKGTTIKFHEVLTNMEQQYVEAYKEYIAARQQSLAAPRMGKRMLERQRLDAIADDARTAFANGLLDTDNPHAKGTPNNKHWDAAWQGAWYRSTQESNQ